MSQAKSAAAFVAFMSVVIAAEVACAQLAWHTVGEVHSGIMLALVCCNVAPLLAYAMKLRKLAVAQALIGVLLSVPWQVALGVQWHLLSEETLNVAAYAERIKRQTGSYPKNFSSYKYLHPTVKPDLIYEFYNSNDYAVIFHLGSEDTSHWYEAGSGWWYYPD